MNKTPSPEDIAMTPAPTMSRLDLTRQADTWGVVAHLMDRVAQRLERAYGNRFGACPNAAAASAVRVLLEQLDDPEREPITFDSPRQIYCWLLLTARRKLRDRVRQEYLERRHETHGDLPGRYENLADGSCDDSLARLEAFIASLTPEQRAVYEGRLRGDTLPQIAEALAVPLTRVETLNRQIQRKAERELKVLRP